MADKPIDLEEIGEHSLNIEGLKNIPICPLCLNTLELPDDSYEYIRIEADTRWFFCVGCDAHFGYHRMSKKWKVDPYDLDTSAEVRKHFGLETQ